MCRLLGLLVAILALWGCSGITDGSQFQGRSPGPDEPAGYVIASIAAPAEHQSISGYTLMFRNADSDRPEWLEYYAPEVTGNLTLHINELADNKFDFQTSEYRGTVMIVRLPPGKYKIYNFVIRGGGGTSSARENFSIPFEVVNGKATYIGFYESLSLRRAGAFYWHLSDERERDMAIAWQRRPELAQLPVDYNVPDGGAINTPLIIRVPQ